MSALQKLHLKDLFFLFALAAVLQAIVQLSLGGWHPVPAFPWAIVLNLSFLLLPLSLLRLFLGRLPLTLFSLIAALAFSLLNYRKIALLNEPVVVADFFRFQLSPLVLRFLGAPEWLAVGFLLILPFGLLHAWRKKRKSGSGGWNKLVPLSLLAAGLLCLGLGFEPYRLRWLNFTVPRFGSELAEARMHGFFTYFLLNARNLRIETPPDYSEAAVKEALATELSYPPVQAKARDLVLVMLESFSDLQDSGLEFERNFLPFVTDLRREASHVAFVSPVVGGLTANAEYEALTGLPWKFLPGGTVPYLSYIRHPLPSVVSEFRRHGFSALAIHPGQKAFWNRAEVYNHLGFDSFTAQENWPSEGRIFDRNLFLHSLELLKEKNRKPQFQFLISIDTHGPYNDPPPAVPWLKAGQLPAAQEKRFNRYAELMRRLDQDLEYYFQELRKLPDPPVVVLFGDHQPEMSVELLQQGRKFNPYRISALYWNARGFAYQGKDLYCIAPSLLESAGVPLSRFFSFVNRFCEESGSISAELQGHPILSKQLERFRALSFDRLFGHQFSER